MKLSVSSIFRISNFFLFLAIVIIFCTTNSAYAFLSDFDPLEGADPLNALLDENSQTTSNPHKSENTELSNNIEHQNYQTSQFHFGPIFFLAIPHPINYGLDIIANNSLSFGFSLGSIPEIKIDTARLNFSYWDVRARYHPSESAFFLGIAVGEQTLHAKNSGETSQGGTSEAIPFQVEATIVSRTATPHFGWLFSWESGFCLGTEIGYQLTISSNSHIKTSTDTDKNHQETLSKIRETEDYKKAVNETKNTSEKFGKTEFIYWNILKLGYLF